MGFTVGFIVGLVVGLVVGFTVGLVVGLIVGLVVGLIVGHTPQSSGQFSHVSPSEHLPSPQYEDGVEHETPLHWLTDASTRFPL